MTKSRENHTGNTFIKKKMLTKKNSKIIKLLKRRDFLSVGSRVHVRTLGFNLYAKKRAKTDHNSIEDLIRIGFTCSKKVGNAVKRNTAKRRLRHLARECLPFTGKPGWDYIVVGNRKNTIEMDFKKLKNSFANAVERIHWLERSN